MWYSIMPPLLAVTLAILTTRLLPSLSIAVGVGILLSWYQQGSVPIGFLTEIVWFVRAVSIGNEGVDLFNFWVVLFVCLIMATISVVVASGGIGGVGRMALSVCKGTPFRPIHHGIDGDRHLHRGLFQRHACRSHHASAHRSSPRQS